jgi:arylsulfatase A-like enzyme
VEEDGKKFVETPAQPHYNASLAMDLFANAVGENENVAALALENLEKCRDKPFVLFIHFWDPDHTGHAHGENSQQYTDAIKDDDMWTGKIVEKLKELGVYEKTLIYIAVDHGFNEGEHGHSYAPYVFLATNDPAVTRDGVREDVAPTILKRLGFDLSKIEPPLDGIPLDEPAPERKAPAEKPGDASTGSASAENASAADAAPAKPKARKKGSAAAPAKARAGK